jgi:23S rRNA (guanine745-N1)-methyltransferase
MGRELEAGGYRASALAAVAPLLACPNCGAPLAAAGGGGALGCRAGHRFDVARHGHVTLLPPGRRAAAGDTPAMVAAREAFLAGGHFAPIEEAVVDAARAAAPGEGAVVELGAGTGRYLAAVLDALPGRPGIALDASRAALRRAVRGHRRVAGVVADVWQGLPLQDGAAGLVLDVFAPRNGAEIARTLRPGGALVVVTPAPEHLRELVGALGLVAVDPAKAARLHGDLGAAGLRPLHRREVRFTLRLDRAAAAALARMGPSAHHLPAEAIAARAAALPEPCAVSASVLVETFGG